MVTQADKTNTSVVATIVVVGAFAMISISALLTAMVRSEEADVDAVRPTHADLDTIAALDKQQTDDLHAAPHWSDKDTRRVSIPIEHAMKLVLSELQKDPNLATPPVPPGLVLPPAPPPVGAEAAPGAPGAAPGSAAPEATPGLPAPSAPTAAAPNAPAAVAPSAPAAVPPSAPAAPPAGTKPPAGAAAPAAPHGSNAAPPTGASPSAAPGPAAPAAPPVPPARKL